MCAYAPPVSGVRSVAAPVFRGRVLIAAMAIVGTTAWVPEGVDSPIAVALRRTAADVTADLGD
jgi:DNA-binding IclR family transcriptional regulator